MSQNISFRVSNRWHLCCTKVFFDIWEMIMPLLPKLMLLWRQNGKSKFCVWLLGQKRRKWKKKQRRGWRDPLETGGGVAELLPNKNFGLLSYCITILLYSDLLLEKLRLLSPQLSSSKNNKWNLQSRVVLITLCFRFFRACRIIKSVSNSQKEVSKKTRRHEQKRRVTKQKSDEKPEK